MNVTPTERKRLTREALAAAEAGDFDRLLRTPSKTYRARQVISDLALSVPNPRCTICCARCIDGGDGEWWTCPSCGSEWNADHHPRYAR